MAMTNCEVNSSPRQSSREMPPLKDAIYNKRNTSLLINVIHDQLINTAESTSENGTVHDGIRRNNSTSGKSGLFGDLDDRDMRNIRIHGTINNKTDHENLGHHQSRRSNRCHKQSHIWSCSNSF